MKKTELKPGLQVRNTVSNRIGTLRADPKNPKKLHRAHRQYVAVMTGPSGRRGLMTPLRPALWYVPNLASS